MPKLTEAKLRSWHRRAAALDSRAKRLMDDMMKTLGAEGDNTDHIDNVTHATEELCSLLLRPELDMWNIQLARRRS